MSQETKEDTGVYPDSRTFDSLVMRTDFVNRFKAKAGKEPSYATTVHYVLAYRDALMRNGFSERAP